MPADLDLGSSAAAATVAAAAAEDSSSAVRKPRAVMTTWCTRQLEDSDVFGDVFHGGDSSGRGLFDALRQQQLLQQGGGSAVHVEDVTGYDPAIVQVRSHVHSAASCVLHMLAVLCCFRATS
jgi:hypothetical protein